MRLFPWFAPRLAVAALSLFASAVLRAQDASVPAPAAGEVAAEETEPTIKGIELKRPGGGYLGVRTEGVVLRVTFYDDKKKETAADAVRISARWRDESRSRFAVLLPTAPETLSSPGIFYRPFNYTVYLVLIGADDKEIESHSLRLTGSDA